VYRIGRNIYDNLGHVTSHKNPSNETIEYTYPANGLVNAINDVRGNIPMMTTETLPLKFVQEAKAQII